MEALPPYRNNAALCKRAAGGGDANGGGVPMEAHTSISEAVAWLILAVAYAVVLAAERRFRKR
jgi:hypothetical protein